MKLAIGVTQDRQLVAFSDGRLLVGPLTAAEFAEFLVLSAQQTQDLTTLFTHALSGHPELREQPPTKQEEEEPCASKTPSHNED